MKVQMIMWMMIALFYAIVGAIYLALSGDPAGATVLLIACPFGGLVAGWLWHHQHDSPTFAADRVDGDPTDETGIVGTYTSDSIRPLALAVGFVAAWLGLVVGLWLTGTALALIASQIMLIVRDADR